MLVLKVLNWDLSTVTPYTVLNQLLSHHCLGLTPHTASVFQRIAPTIRLRSETLIALAATETTFLDAPPTLVATACLAATVSGIRHQIEAGDRVFRQLVETLTFMTGHGVEEVLTNAARMESLVLDRLSGPDFGTVPTPNEHFLGLVSSNSKLVDLSSSTIGIETERTSSTPTEMMDVSAACVC